MCKKCKFSSVKTKAYLLLNTNILSVRNLLSSVTKKYPIKIQMPHNRSHALRYSALYFFSHKSHISQIWSIVTEKLRHHIY